MGTGKNTYRLLIICLLFIAANTMLHAQTKKKKIAKTHTGISDSTITIDSTISKKASVKFLLQSLNENDKPLLTSFSLSKKQIDKLDYKNLGDILSQLPFSFLNDFGYTGAPSEPKIYSLGFENISVENDGVSSINNWNLSNDLNRIQTEGIGLLEIVPLDRGFLYGFLNNSSAINIITSDSIKSKPISRIRYYQASNEEGFIDAMFSAKVLPRFALSFRVTNISQDGNYANTAFSAWKANLKGIYKFSDSLFLKISYNHLKLNTPFNGGIDLNSLFLNSSSPASDIFSNQSLVVFSTMKNITTSNTVLASVYGNFIPSGNTNITLLFNQNNELFKNGYDTVDVNNANKYNLLSASIKHEIEINKFTSTVAAGYQEINYDVESIRYKDKKTSYYASLIADYNFFNGLFKPAVFGKYSNYESQNNNGFGFDLTISPLPGAKLLLGFSNFNKPYSILESLYLSNNIVQKYATRFVSLEFNSNMVEASISYFNTESSNTPIPVFNSSDISKTTTAIIYHDTDNIKTNGFNINTKIKFWDILTTANFNYYKQSENSYLPLETNFNLTAGLYYVDTLYNNNLDLKTGFTFYLSDNLAYKRYDFQNMRSSGYYLENDTYRAFYSYSTGNNPYRLDFLLAGRIQDAATIYLVYENILSNNYFIVPYFPMSSGGIRIGISWDFLD